MSSNLAAWIRAMKIDRMYITRKNAIHAPFVLSTRSKTAEEEALLDSGATHNFIDKRMAKRLGLGTKRLSKPRTVRNVDGTDNQGGTLTRYTDLEVSFEKTTEVQRFYITDLGEDWAIFGFPWLQTYRPKIDWANARLIGGLTRVKTMTQEPPEWARISRIVLNARRIAKNSKLKEGEEIHLIIGKTNVAQ